LYICSRDIQKMTIRNLLLDWFWYKIFISRWHLESLLIGNNYMDATYWRQ